MAAIVKSVGHQVRLSDVPFNHNFILGGKTYRKFRQAKSTSVLRGYCLVENAHQQVQVLPGDTMVAVVH